MNISMKNEDCFLINVSRTCLSEYNIAKLKELSTNRVINWEIFLRKVSKHNLSGLIYYSLTRNNLDYLIPEKVYRFLKNEYCRTAILNEIIIEEINKLSKIIDNKIILLKGADLIQNTYPNIGVRSMSDLDILADKAEAENIWTKLQENGFKSKGIVDIYKSTVHGKYHTHQPVHLCGLYNEKYLLEIHWNLFIRENLFYLTQKAWESAYHFKDNLYLLSNEMMVIYLCSHFFRHKNGSASLRMLCDINEVIIKYRDILDWNEIKCNSFNTELEYIIKYTLTYTSALFNTLIPGEFILENIFRKKNFNLDRIDIREKNGDVFERFKNKINKIYWSKELFVFVYRTLVPVREWIIYTYKISPKGNSWKGYVKYWKYLFLKYLLFRRIQPGN
jgi:hypothetical protein